MRNQLTLVINGQTYELKFNVGTYKILRDLTGQDPFTYAAASQDFHDVLEWTKNVFHAALLKGDQARGEKRTYTDEELTGIVEAMSTADLFLIDKLWRNQADSQPQVNGEVAQNTQQGVNLG